MNATPPPKYPILYSLACFREILLDALRLARARRVMEIGSEYGDSTRELCRYAQEHGGRLIAVDPAPQPEALAFARSLADSPWFEFIEGTSLDVLPSLREVDAYIIDGDHNYYTVRAELEVIARARGLEGLLVFEHDVGWPWARRDMYYAPDRIPAESRHPYSLRGGVAWGVEGLVRGGFGDANPFAIALHEGGPRNGVRTAIEDFVSEHASLVFASIPVVFGLGVIYDRQAPWAPALESHLRPWVNSPLLERLEQNRLWLSMEFLRAQAGGGPWERLDVVAPHPAPGPSQAAQPLNVDALRHLAAREVAASRWPEAASAQEALARRLPDDVEVWRNAIQYRRLCGHAVLAELLAEEAIERHPEWQSLFAESSREPDPITQPVCRDHAERPLSVAGFAESFRRGTDAFERSDWATARDAFIQAARLDPASALVHLHLGATLVHLDDLDGATAAARQALQIDQDSLDATRLLAALLRARGRHSEACPLFSTLEQRVPGDVDALLGSAECLLRLGDPGLAESRYRQVLQQVPGCREAQDGLRAATQARTRRNGSGSCAPTRQTSRPQPARRILPLTTHALQTRAEFDVAWEGSLAEALKDQQPLQPPGAQPFQLPGLCAVCDATLPFTTDYLFSFPDEHGRQVPAWRERQICRCGLNCRQRSCFHVLARLGWLSTNARIYLTEHATALFRHAATVFPSILGSEFLENEVPLGHCNARGVRNEDVTRLTFKDASFDAIMSTDVLEHVPDYESGLREFARCLKPGGKLLLTVPFHFQLDQTVRRAVIEPDGTITHRLPPVYHGDPIRPEGCLCFNDFGWDLLTVARHAGFSQATLHVFTDPAYGYVGLQHFLWAVR